MQFVKINYPDIYLLEKFVSIAGTSLETFRYFAKRPFSVIQQHVCTFVLCEENEPLAYGHLDKEDGTVWLGIAVIEKAKGKGIGKLMMEQLLSFARQQNIKSIGLSVDNDNSTAINLYLNLGFKLIEEKEKFSFYQLDIK